jgi:hypothetical protein
VRTGLITLFRRVTVQSKVVYAYNKLVYFSHTLFVQDGQYAALLGPLALVKPPALQLWDDALAMRGALRYGASAQTPPGSLTRRSGAADWYATERMACNMGALINLGNTDT